MATDPARFAERISLPTRGRLCEPHELRGIRPSAVLAAIALLACTGAAEPSPASAPAAQVSSSDGTAKLHWARFPPEFADYYCTQGIPAQPLTPKPGFCLSDKPLLLDARHTAFATTMVLDESGGTGSGYDTLYVDLQRNGQYMDNPVCRAGPFAGQLGPDHMPVLAYFPDVTLPRQGQAANVHVQLFLEKTLGDDLNCALIPQRWAVGTLTAGGRTMPAALVDTNWDGQVTGLGGYEPGQPSDIGPRGSDCLILGIDGEPELRPPTDSRGLFIPGDGGSAKGFLARHLVLDNGTYQLRVTQTAAGARLALAPAQVPVAVVKLTDKPRTSHLLLVGRSTCVMSTGQASEILVPADTYLLMNRPHSRHTFAIKPGERREIDPVPQAERVAALQLAILTTRPAAAQASATPAAPSPKTDAWTHYVRQFVATYQMQGPQQEQAQSILKDLKDRRDEYRTAHKIDYEAAGKLVDPAKRSADLAALEEPVDVMFEELKTRLMTLPTEAQRKAAQAAAPPQAAPQTRSTQR